MNDADAVEVQWVVNSLGELGVRVVASTPSNTEKVVGFFFLYKGESLQYPSFTEHEEDTGTGWKKGEPLQWRPVFKREFGECAHPLNPSDPSRVGTVSREVGDWKDLEE